MNPKSRTIKSFLASRPISVRDGQIDELDLYVKKRKENGKKNIYFVKYWGGSDKLNMDNYDYDALLNLFGFLKSVEKRYDLEVQLTIIFTDTHVMLNGYNQNSKQYFKQVRRILNEFNYSHILMSEVLKPFIKQHKLKDINGLIESIISQTKIYEIPTYLKGRESFELLKNSASKYSLRINNEKEFKNFDFSSAGQSAYSYITLNQLEKEFIERIFFQSVFLTYTSNEEKELISPNLPSIQLFSYKKGFRSRPWFLKNTKNVRNSCYI